jgi:hypothetical protein
LNFIKINLKKAKVTFMPHINPLGGPQWSSPLNNNVPLQHLKNDIKSIQSTFDQIESDLFNHDNWDIKQQVNAISNLLKQFDSDMAKMNPQKSPDMDKLREQYAVMQEDLTKFGANPSPANLSQFEASVNTTGDTLQKMH